MGRLKHKINGKNITNWQREQGKNKARKLRQRWMTLIRETAFATFILILLSTPTMFTNNTNEVLLFHLNWPGIGSGLVDWHLDCLFTELLSLPYVCGLTPAEWGCVGMGGELPCGCFCGCKDGDCCFSRLRYTISSFSALRFMSSSGSSSAVVTGREPLSEIHR